jgi:osmotically-inducible protein OsmY
VIDRSSLRIVFSLGAMLASTSLGGCIPIIIGGAAASGYTLATEDRSPQQIAIDAAIAAAAHKYWADASSDLARDVSATAYDSRLLITGIVPNQTMKTEAERRARQIDGLKEIYNEVQVGAPTTLGQDARDNVVSNSLRAKLLGDAQVRSTNFTVHTLNGIVYIIGFARNAAERDLVLTYARNLSNVTRVVSYIRVGNEAAPPAPANAAPRNVAPPPPPAEEPQSAAPVSRDSIEVTPLP